MLPYLTAYKGVVKASDVDCDDYELPFSYWDLVPGQGALDTVTELSLGSIYRTTRDWY